MDCYLLRGNGDERVFLCISLCSFLGDWWRQRGDELQPGQMRRAGNAARLTPPLTGGETPSFGLSERATAGNEYIKATSKSLQIDCSPSGLAFIS